MIVRIDTHNYGILTRDQLSVSEWAAKFDGFISLSEFSEDAELVNSLTMEFQLNETQQIEVAKLLSSETIRYFRFNGSTNEHFNLEPVFLNIKSNKGKLIYWKDWEYIFQEIDQDFYLWCYLGGQADLHREIKLSNEQVEKYKEKGLAQIDYLIDDLKKLHYSTEYEKAIKENRRIV